MPYNDKLRLLSQWIADARYAIALTGAGISVDSNIPCYRGSQGLWEKYDMMEYANIDAFQQNPARVWEMLVELDRTIVAAQPNSAHEALARLEDMGRLQMIVTQNVDNLHQSAGSRNVVEFHGNANTFSCVSCGSRFSREQVSFQDLPPRCACGGPIKPDVIFFGEAIPQEAGVTAFEAARRTDLLLVIGTSAVVSPASEIPVLAKYSGARVVEINTEETVLTGRVSDLHLMASAADVLPAVVQALRKNTH